MAEIRKHHPKVTSAIDQALMEAMGEPVRPLAPGEKPPVTKKLSPTPTVTSMPLMGGSWSVPLKKKSDD